MSKTKEPSNLTLGSEFGTVVFHRSSTYAYEMVGIVRPGMSTTTPFREMTDQEKNAAWAVYDRWRRTTYSL